MLDLMNTASPRGVSRPASSKSSMGCLFCPCSQPDPKSPTFVVRSRNGLNGGAERNQYLSTARKLIEANDLSDAVLYFLKFLQTKCRSIMEGVHVSLQDIAAVYDVSTSSELDARVWDELGVLYFDMGSVDEADICYETALKIMPRDASVLYHRGILFQMTGDYEEAISCLESASYYSDCRTLSAMAPIFSLGTLYRRLGKFDEAIECFEYLLTGDPCNTAGLALVADCFEAKGQNAEAICYLQRAVEIDPHDHSIKRALDRLKYSEI